MTANIISPYPYFTDARGNPLEGGQIYIGTAGLDPRTNPVAVFQDAALTIPWSPIRTVGGYPSYQGAPSNFYTAAMTYSIIVMTRQGEIVFRDLNASGFINLDTFEDYATSPADLSTSGDQSAALQAIINAAAVANKRNVTIAEGTFAIKDVSIPSGMRVSGKGIDKTILQRAAALTSGILTLAANASDVTISDMTIDGLSAADTVSLIRATAHGSRITFERVKFVNGCQRWALRMDPAAQFSGVTVKDCVFDNCPQGGFIMIATAAAVAGSSNIQIIGNTWTNSGHNLCQMQPYAPSQTAAEFFQFDFYYSVKYNFNRVLSCSNTGTNGPIPNELWGCHGLQQIGNYLDSGTRGLSGGEGQRNGVIAFNVIKNQTAYAMEGGNNSDNVHIHRNIAVNCATFYKSTGTVSTLNSVLIENNIIQGSGQTSYAARDCIALGIDGVETITNCAIRNNRIEGYKFGRSIIRVLPLEANSTSILIEGNIYISSDADDAVTLVNATNVNFISRNNRVRRTANFASTHGAGSIQSFYFYGGRTSAAGANCVSENDTAEMTGTVSSGSLYAIGRSEAATARYGMRATGFRAIGNFSTGPFFFADNTGTTILQGFDLRGLASQTGVNTNVNASLALGLASGTALIKDSTYIKAAAVGQARSILRYQGTIATRTIKIRCDATSGGQAPATFIVDFVCANNNSAPSINRVMVGFASVSAPAGAPTMFQDSGTAATLTSALSGSLMEATITLPVSNNTWIATITADAAGTVGSGLADYSVRIA